MTTSGPVPSSSSSEPQAFASCSPANASVRSGSMSKQAARRSSPSAAERLCPIRPQPTTATSSKLAARAARELEAEAQLLGAGGAHGLAGVVGPRRVDEQEAAAARADELAAQRAGA